jgi:hypothetical protein
MARGLPAAAAAAFLLLFAVAASAAPDMSIISYNDEHGARGLERTEAEARAMYDLWLAEHGRAYNALGEHDRRFRVFWDNLRFVDAHNARAGEHGYSLGMNQFADLTNEEFRAAYLGARLPARTDRVAAEVPPRRRRGAAGDRRLEEQGGRCSRQEPGAMRKLLGFLCSKHS